MIRKPIVAGQFYPFNKTELEKEVRNYLGRQEKENAKAAIVPHAGYFFSGKLAGKVIGKIKEKKTFIISGVNHSGLGNKISISLEDFETPLGIVKNDVSLGKKILSELKRENLDASGNEQAHQYEHSIEVELPFLQLSQKNFSIVPILFKDLSFEECKKIAEVLADFIDGNTCILVSSDFTHYGYNYGFVPFSDNIRENLYKLDKSIIKKILDLNSKEVYEKARKSTVCGLYGITIITEIAKIKKMKAKLVDYYASGDVLGDFDSAVGYAGLVFG